MTQSFNRIFRIYIFIFLLFLAPLFTQAGIEEVFYSDSSSGNASTDGRMFEDRKNNWLDAVNSASARIVNTEEVGLTLSNSLGSGFGDSYYSLNRFHLGFDTSSLPDNAKILRARLEIFAKDRDDDLGSEKTLYLVSNTPLSDNSLSTSDFAKVGDSALGSTDGAWDLPGTNIVQLNQSGLNYLNKTGVTNFAIRGWYDFQEIAPTASEGIYLNFYTADIADQSLQPKLIVEYEINDSESLEDLISELIEKVEGSEDLEKSDKKSYLAHLQGLVSKYEKGQTNAFDNQLDAFVRKLETDIESGEVTEATANEWLGLAADIKHRVTEVPLVTQVDPTWSGDVYAGGAASSTGGCGLTIESCGCVLSSMSMIAGYHDIETGVDGTAVNPANLNDWLESNEGYTAAGSVYWGKLVEYLSTKTDAGLVSYLSHDAFNETSQQKINQALASDNPAMAYSFVPGGYRHYYVLADTFGNGYTVRDPFWFNTKTSNDVRSAANNVQDYNNSFLGAQLFSYQADAEPLAGLVELHLASPAELLLTDSQGRKLGKDPVTGEVFNQIPGGFYGEVPAVYPTSEQSDVPAHVEKVLRVANPNSLTYHLQVIGTDDGDYTLSSLLRITGESGETEDIFAETTFGQVDEYEVELSEGYYDVKHDGRHNHPHGPKSL